MAPKQKKSAPAQKSKGEEEREEPLQAVVFADSFESTFAPFTLEKPRCLLPLANTPLLEYTLEFLASVGVEEVILYGGNHFDMLEDYLKRSKWLSKTSLFDRFDIFRSSGNSIGDAMRDLDQKQRIKGDFICVYGDIVANIPLEAALTAHRARREKTRKSIITMVLREAGSSHNRTKQQLIRPAFVINPHDGRCVHYEQIRRGERPRLDISEEVLRDHVEVEVREDLIDCGIDICTPEVLAQYTDNFDWQAPRRGFLYGVLKDFETNQLMIHTHILKEGYAARVTDLRAYDAVSRDVVGRWAWPMSPDSNLLVDQSYALGAREVYKEDGVVLARGCNVGRRCVLGKATSIGEGSLVEESVLGRRCIIGKRVRLKGVYIFDDARIGDGTVIERAVIGNSAGIGKGCRIEPGALVATGVAISDGITVKGSSRLTKVQPSASGDKPEPGTTDPKVVGEAGVGYDLPVDEDEDELLETLVPRQLDDMDDAALSDDSISDLESEDEDEADSLTSDAKRRSSRSESFTSINSDESGDTRRRAADFHHEATASIVDALQKEEDPNTIQLELQALKLSSNAEDKQVRRAVAVSLMKRIAGLVESGSTPKDAVSKIILPNKLLIERCVAAQKEIFAEQVEFLLYMQTDLVHRHQGSKILLFASNVLASEDLVEAEGFEAWWEDERSFATEELKTVREDTRQLVEVLVGDDESEEEEESGEESG